LVWEGHWQGVWDGSPPMGSRGRAPVRVGLRAKPQQNEECYVMRVKNHVLTERKNKYIHIDIL